MERLEVGRTRALGEALARDRAALQEASQQDRVAFAAAANQIKALEAEGRSRQAAETPAAPGALSFAEHSAELVRLRERLAAVIQRIRNYLPEFMAGGLSYPEIAAAASPERPLVYLLTTSLGSLALLVPAGPQAPAAEHAVWLDGLTAERVDEMLGQRDSSGELRGYLSGQVAGKLDQFAAALAGNIVILRRELFGPLAGCLASLHVAAATLVPVGHRRAVGPRGSGHESGPPTRCGPSSHASGNLPDTAFTTELPFGRGIGRPFLIQVVLVDVSRGGRSPAG